jgi:superfamily II DNA/RNA helicase
MEKFHAGRVYVLVCTDVAARGLDVKNVSHVYNYDAPKTSEEYIHRIGRTARAGNEGIAISLISERDYDNFRNVLRDESIKPEQVEVPQVEKIWIEIPKRFGRDRDNGRRGFGGRGGGSRGRFGGSRGGSRGHSNSRGRFGSSFGRSRGRRF